MSDFKNNLFTLWFYTWLFDFTQWRSHGEDWGGHVHRSCAPDRSFYFSKSEKIVGGGGGGGSQLLYFLVYVKLNNIAIFFN